MIIKNPTIIIKGSGTSNADYVKQQDLIASINYGRKYNESDYTEEEIEKIQELLDDMVIGG